MEMYDWKMTEQTAKEFLIRPAFSSPAVWSVNFWCRIKGPLADRSDDVWK